VVEFLTGCCFNAGVKIMKNRLDNIDAKKKKLDSLRPFPAALIKNLDEWFRIEHTYTSNALEGNTLTKSETALVVEKGITIGGKSMREHLEAINLASALDFMQSFITKKQSDISSKDLCDIHSLILKKIDDKHAGVFRKVPVKISQSDVVLPDPIKVPDLMDEFISWLHSAKDHPVIVAADAHFKFVTIHPFVDGNGRLARLLMNILLMQHGYPPVSIRPSERKSYIDGLEKGQTTGKLDDFYTVVYDAVLRSLDMYLDALAKTID